MTPRGDSPPGGYAAARVAAAAMWKEATLVLAAVLVSLMGSWFAFGRDAVTQDQVVNLIALHSPYAIDKAQIQEQLQGNSRAIDTATARVEELRDEITQLQVTLARVEQKLSSHTSKGG